MKTQDIDKLRKSIREAMRHRKEDALKPYMPSRFRMFAIRIMPFVLIVFIVFTIYISMQDDITDEGIIFLWTFNFTLLIGILSERLKLSTHPQGNKDEIEQWIWKKNLKSGIYAFLLLMGLTLIYSLIYTNPITQYVLAVDFVILGVVGLCLVLVIINPLLFLNPLINSVGTLGIIVFSVLYILRLILTYQYFWALIGAGALIPFLFSWWVTRKEQKLTLFQMTVLQSIDTNRLFKSLRSYREVLRDRSRALATWLKLEEEFSHGEREEFLRLLAPVYNSGMKNSYKTIFNIFASLLLAVISAIVALITEDFLYVPVLKTYFCHVNFLQSWLSCQ